MMATPGTVTKTLNEITAMQQAYFEQGRQDAFRELENMTSRVAHKLDKRRNHWRERKKEGMEVDTLLLFTTLQFDFYRELAEWLQDERNTMRYKDKLNLAE